MNDVLVECDPEELSAASTRTSRPVAGPFLKWAGGKRQLLPQLRRFIPSRFGTYHEPFLGSAALFFDLWSRGRLRSARLTDTNADLMGCYACVRSEPAAVIAALDRLAAAHARDGSMHYYEARSRYNAGVSAWRAGGCPQPYAVDLAALFIYLNRTGFNGLFRLNASGQFNVPAGRYSKPRICDPGGLQEAAAALSGPNVSLAHAQWERVLDEARPGDLVYFDPPYAPLSSTARFTSYTAGGFTADDQRRLAEAVVVLARRGCHAVLSNSSAPLIEELYDNPAAAAAGLVVRHVPARRAINAKASKRGEVLEVVVSNVQPEAIPVL